MERVRCIGVWRAPSPMLGVLHTRAPRAAWRPMATVNISRSSSSSSSNCRTCPLPSARRVKVAANGSGSSSHMTPPASLAELSVAYGSRGAPAMLQLVDGRNAWEACSIVLSAIRQRSYQPSGAASAAAAVTSTPTGTPTATTTSSHNSSSSSGSKSSSSRSTSRSTSSSSTLAAQCGCLVVLCRHRSVRDLGQGGLLRQLRDSFLAGAPGGRLSTRERRLLLNTALRMVQALPPSSAGSADSAALASLFKELARVAKQPCPDSNDNIGLSEYAEELARVTEEARPDVFNGLQISRDAEEFTGSGIVSGAAASYSPQTAAIRAEEGAASGQLAGQTLPINVQQGLAGGQSAGLQGIGGGAGDETYWREETSRLEQEREDLRREARQLRAAAEAQAKVHAQQLARLEQQLQQLQQPQQQPQLQPAAGGGAVNGGPRHGEGSVPEVQGVEEGLKSLLLGLVACGVRGNRDSSGGSGGVMSSGDGGSGGSSGDGGSGVGSGINSSGDATSGAGGPLTAQEQQPLAAQEQQPGAAHVAAQEQQQRDAQMALKEKQGAGGALAVRVQYDIPVEGFVEAVQAGDVEELSRMLAANPNNVNEYDEVLLTPLHYAASLGDAACVAALLQHGADIHMLDQIGDTPLHLALCGGAPVEVLEALLRAGADPCAANHGGWTPIHTAAASDHVEALQLLIGRGADVNAKNQAGDTPLHLAARSGALQSVQLLVQAGADVRAVNQDGKTAEEVADYDCMHLLMEHAAAQP